jgi:hypothetical protein
MEKEVRLLLACVLASFAALIAGQTYVYASETYLEWPNYAAVDCPSGHWSDSYCYGVGGQYWFDLEPDGYLSTGTIESYADNYFGAFGSSVVDEAVCIALAETDHHYFSLLDRYPGSVSEYNIWRFVHGIFQISEGWGYNPGEMMFNPGYAFAAAAEIYDLTNDWSEWETGEACT